MIDLRHFLRRRLEKGRRDHACSAVRCRNDDLFRWIKSSAFSGGWWVHDFVESSDALSHDHPNRIPRQRRRHQNAIGDRHQDPRSGRSRKLENVECSEGSPDSRQRGGFANSTLRQSKRDRQQHDHAQQEHHPRAVLPLAEPAEEAQCVGGWGNGKNRRRRPSQQLRDRMRQQRSDPAEIPSYVPVAVELGVALGGECAGEEESKKEEDNPANLAGERGRRRLIVPVPARAS